MAIQKSFVIKNGFEVSTDLIIANIDTRKVGIGSTTPRTKLDVRGGIAATDINISGVGTIVTLQSTTGTITNLTATNLFVGVGTIGRIQSTDINNSGVTTSTTLNITGTGTIAVGVVTFLSGTNLNYSGIGTIGSLNSTNANVSGVGTIVNARVTNLNVTGVSTIASLSVTGSTFDTLVVNNFSTLNGITTLTNARVTNLNVTGVSTFSSVNTGNINIAGIVTGLNVSGVSTLGIVRISSGIITATSGIVTYFGDGQYLTGLAANPTLQTVLNTGNTSTIGMSISGIITASSGFTGNISGTAGTITTLNSTSGNITNISGTAGTITTLNSTSGNITNISGTAGTITTLNSTSGTITNISGTNLNYSGIGTITNLSGVAINITGIATAQDFDALSDENYKKNVITVNNALNKVEQLRGVSFDWKENGRSSYGVIAQELQKVLPELVHGDNPKTVNYNGIIGVLIEAIKELKKEVEELKNLIV
jgi:hypothetical protein